MSSIDNRDPLSDYIILKKEIEKYDKKILKKPYLILLNKKDAQQAKKNIDKFLKYFPKEKDKIFKISALKKEDLQKLLERIKKIIFPS